MTPTPEQLQAAREFVRGSAWSGIAGAPDEEVFWLAALLAEREAAAIERCAKVADERQEANAQSATYWAENKQGQTAGFAQIREHEARDLAAAIRATSREGEK